MNQDTQSPASRREFLKNTGRIAAASALAGVAIPHVHAAESNTIQVALIGCGGRGTGAAADALSVKNGPIKLVAMADAFQDRLDSSFAALKKQFGDQIDVPNDRKFVGFDAYQKAMDCLKPGDVAIFATPLAFRWVHFAYAIEKGLNVFMEKPLTADGPTSRRMLKLAEESTAKNLKVGVGLMSRHSRALQQLADRIHDGEIGDLILLRGYRMHGPIVGYLRSASRRSMSEVEFQIRKFHAFLWASGGTFSDFYIHIIDHCCWMKNAWPVKAQALGGRHYRQSSRRRSLHRPELRRLFRGIHVCRRRQVHHGRTLHRWAANKSTPAPHKAAKAWRSSRRAATVEGLPASTRARFPTRSNQLWESKVDPGEQNPYQNEWNDLVDAIRAR